MKRLINLKNNSIIIAAFFILYITPVTISQNIQRSPQEANVPQFLYPEFTAGTITLKNGTTQSFDLNYNTLSGKMVFKLEGEIYEVVNPGLIDTVFLRDTRFITIGRSYYEVLYEAPVTLFVQYSGKLIPPPKPAGYGGTSQTSSTTVISSLLRSDGAYNMSLPADYEVTIHPVYWVRVNDRINDFINRKQVYDIFPDKKSDIKAFIKDNRIKFDEKADMIELIKFCNTFYQ
jgi:hypothetical protein